LKYIIDYKGDILFYKMTSTPSFMQYSWCGNIYAVDGAEWDKPAFSITYPHESVEQARDALLALLEKSQQLVYPDYPHMGQSETSFRNDYMSNALNAEVKFWIQGELQDLYPWQWNTLASHVKPGTIVSDFWTHNKKMTLKDYILKTEPELTPMPEVGNGPMIYTTKPASVCLWYS